MTKEVIYYSDYASIKTHSIIDDYSILTIAHPKFDATVSVYAGHVLTWQPKNEKPVLWLSKTAEYAKGKAVRGGIPICWPWFGPNIDSNGNNLGNHGFARNTDWQLGEVSVTQEKVILELVLAGENMHPAWPHKFTLRQIIEFSEELHQTLEVKNETQATIQVGHAFHGYFAVGHPSKVTVPNLYSHPFDDKITGLFQQRDNPLNCVGPIDRIYYNNDVQHIIDAEWNRIIEMESRNAQNWVLWNPGKNIASGMADVHVGGENEYVCLEPANTQWLDIPPGQSCTVGQVIKVLKP